uniref:DNA helicase n=1 Tax=Klebsiella phage vB-Kvc-Y10 TaxID=3236922 RepID=A0AB39CBS5_9CAUD
MAVDTLLLAVLANRSKYKALASAVPKETLGAQTGWLLDAYGKFFEQNKKKERVDFDVLATMVRLKLDETAAGPALALVEAARNSRASEEQEKLVIAELYERRLSGLAASLVNRYEDGDDVDISYELYRVAMETRKLLGTATDSLFKEPDIHEILSEQASDTGLKFPLLCLQEHVKGLMPPVNVALCAGVDSGKTSFIARTVVHWAPQCVKLFPGRPILWLSNEGVVREIWPRVYAAALNKNSLKMAELTRDELYAQYEAAMGGDRSILKLLDIHGWSMGQVAGLVEELNPCVVILDMVANVRCSKPVTARHEMMETNLQEWREMQALHNFIGFSTIQLSADGLDQLYPAMHHLKDTKIGAQGTLDVQIMMGRLDDPQQQGLRGFSTPKNKRKKVGKPGNFNAQVFFTPDTCHYEDA